MLAVCYLDKDNTPSRPCIELDGCIIVRIRVTSIPKMADRLVAHVRRLRAEEQALFC